MPALHADDPGRDHRRDFDLAEPPKLAARYNVAPTWEVAAVRIEKPGGKQCFVLLRWGLVPHWAGDSSIGNGMINARSESVAEKPAFPTSFKKRRCLVLADRLPGVDSGRQIPTDDPSVIEPQEETADGDGSEADGGKQPSLV